MAYKRDLSTPLAPTFGDDPIKKAQAKKAAGEANIKAYAAKSDLVKSAAMKKTQDKKTISDANVKAYAAAVKKK